MKHQNKNTTHCNYRSPKNWGIIPHRWTSKTAFGCRCRHDPRSATAAARRGHMSRREGCPLKSWKIKAHEQVASDLTNNSSGFKLFRAARAQTTKCFPVTSSIHSPRYPASPGEYQGIHWSEALLSKEDLSLYQSLHIRTQNQAFR